MQQKNQVKLEEKMNKEDWQKCLKSHKESNFSQTEIWQKVNEAINHKTILENFGGTNFALMIVKDAKRGRFLEIPGGPLIDWSDSSVVKKSFDRIKEIAKENKCVFVRFRPQLLQTDENMKLMESVGASTAPFHLHAQNTVILDLTKSEDELLANMRRQTRYEVRRADKLNLKMTTANDQAIFDEFHNVQVSTAERQHFIPPTAKELEAYREIFKDNAVIYKVMTTDEITEDGKHLATEKSDNNIKAGQAVAYGLFIKSGEEADYFEAASTALNYKLPGAYALIWQAMKDFKSQGYSRLNLWGTAPKGQPNHRYAGVTTFKTGYGGEETEFVPAQDIPINKIHYKLDYAFEKERKKW